MVEVEKPVTVKIDAKVYDWLTIVKNELSASLSTKLTYGDTIRWMIEESAPRVRDLIQSRRGEDLEVRKAKGLMPRTSFAQVILDFKDMVKKEDEAIDKMKETESES